MRDQAFFAAIDDAKSLAISGAWNERDLLI